MRVNRSGNLGSIDHISSSCARVWRSECRARSGSD